MAVKEYPCSVRIFITRSDGVRQSVTFVDGHCVRHTVTRDRHSAGRVSRSAQRQSSLDRHVRGGYVERLKCDLRHALSIRLGVQKSFRERNRLHVGPIRDDTVLNGILQLVAGHSSRGASTRSHGGGRVQPWRPTSRVTAKVQQQKPTSPAKTPICLRGLVGLVRNHAHATIRVVQTRYTFTLAEQLNSDVVLADVQPTWSQTQKDPRNH